MLAAHVGKWWCFVVHVDSYGDVYVEEGNNGYDGGYVRYRSWDTLWSMPKCGGIMWVVLW